MSAWTPGPWKVNKYGSVGAGEHGTTPVVLTVEPFYGDDQQYGSHWANLTLAAAAPDLYAALDALDRSWAETFPQGPDGDYGAISIGDEHKAIWHAARAALSRARGETL